MEQEIQYIDIKDLVLWTENPRDPINENATDQEIVDRALEDKYSKWTLNKLAKEMGGYFDYSELPTIVYHDKKPVVYDGNRRIILGKIKSGLVTIPKNINIVLPDFPEKIPCNVCTKKIGLQNVYRKHSDSGSWQPLERDIFLHKFMGEKKSSFLVLEEDTGIISANPHLNQRFVKEEILKDETLNSMGIFVQNGRINSVHNNDETRIILSDISLKVKNKKISTRENRGKIIEVLDPTSQQLIETNRNKKPHLSKVRFDNGDNKTNTQRITKRLNKNSSEIFGGKLFLRIGDVSNLYRDIVDLYKFYIDNKHELSSSFTGLIRMSLRLLCETAAADCNLRTDKFINNNFTEAKKSLDTDIKTTLHTQNVTDQSIISLLNTGAHQYSSSSNLDQTIALSIIIGAILTITHGKEN